MGFLFIFLCAFVFLCCIVAVILITDSRIVPDWMKLVIVLLAIAAVCTLFVCGEARTCTAPNWFTSLLR